MLSAAKILTKSNPNNNEEKKLIKQGVFYLFDDRQRKGKRCILVRYRIGGQFKYVKTGIYIRPNCWDAKRHRAFSGDDYKEVNRHLKAFRRNIESQFELVEGVLTADIVDQIVSGTYIPEAQRNRSTQFVLYARMVNRILYENGRFGLTTMRNKESGINCFEHYEKELLCHDPVTIGGLTSDYLQKYYSFRISVPGHCSRITAARSMEPLFTAIRYARDHCLLSYDEASLLLADEKDINSKHNSRYLPEVRPDRIKSLTIEQIRLLEDYHPEHPRTQDFLDAFLFCFYCCGMRISDMITLEWQNVDLEQLRIHKRQVKTRQRPRIPTYMRPEALVILGRWKGRNPRFVFNFLPVDFDLSDEEALYRRRLSVTRTMNTSLKRIGEKLRLPVVLTSHVQRHTFATFAINNDMPIYTLSALLGHQSIVTTEKVYARLLDKKAKTDYDACMAKVFKE